MKLSTRFLLLLALFIVLAFIQTGVKVQKPQTSIPSPTSPPAVKGVSDSQCHINGALPDPNCTPGVIDPSVTQENLFQTVCSAGYTKKVRPPVEYTNQLKKEQIQEYGYSDTNPQDYEEDHLISLELGGSPTDPKNLWPEPGDSPNPKDTIENMCHQKVCNGTLKLEEAQKEIATNWQTACQ